MISHNSEFTSALCPETWSVEAGRLSAKGQNWMAKSEAKLELKREEETVRSPVAAL